MHALKLTLTLLHSEKKNSLLYLGASSIIFTVIFAILNLLNDKNLVSKIPDEFAILSSTILAIVLFVSLAVNYYSNSFFMEKRKKEIAIELISGLSLGGLAFSSTVVNLIISTISIIIALILGNIISPLINSFLYTLVGINANYNFSFESCLIAIVIISINIMILSIVNVGLGYRTEICDLVRSKSGSYKRKIIGNSKKLVGIISSIIAIWSFIAAIISKESDAIAILGPLGILFFIIIVKMYLPYLLGKLAYKLKNPVTNIVLNNLIIDLEKSLIPLIISGFIVGVVCYSLVFFYDAPNIMISCIGSLFLLLILFIIGTLYTIASLAYSRIRNFKILLALGFTKKNIDTIILKEMISFLALLLLIPALYLIITLLRFSTLGFIPTNISTILLTIILITFFLVFILSYFTYFKIIKMNLYGGTNNE